MRGNTSFKKMPFRKGFTLVEVSLGAALAVLVLISAFQILMSGNRNTHALTKGLEANEALLRTYGSLSRDVRQSKDIWLPTNALADEPMPAFSYVSEDEGTHVLVVDTYRIAFVNEEFKVFKKRVRWSLGNPDDVESRQGPVKIFELFRQVSEEIEAPFEEEEDPNAAPFGTVGASNDMPLGDKVKMGEGIIELIFFRKTRDPENPDPQAGNRNLWIRMKAARVRRYSGTVSYTHLTLPTTPYV